MTAPGGGVKWYGPQILVILVGRKTLKTSTRRAGVGAAVAKTLGRCEARICYKMG